MMYGFQKMWAPDTTTTTNTSVVFQRFGVDVEKWYKKMIAWREIFTYSIICSFRFTRLSVDEALFQSNLSFWTIDTWYA